MPKQDSKSPKCLDEGDYFLVVGDRMFAAKERSRNHDGTVTVDLYQNVRLYIEGVPHEVGYTCRFE